MKRFLKVALVAATLTAGVPCAANAIEFVVGSAAAVSGDTIMIGSPGQRPVTLRLWGIEAPAMSEPRDVGLFARAALDDLLRRHGPAVKCTLDSFERTTAVCHAGETDLGAAMLLSGWAVTDRTVTLADVPGVDSERAGRVETYHEAEAGARRERRGRWARMPGQ